MCRPPNADGVSADLLSRWRAGRIVNALADSVAAHNELNPAILLPPLRRVVCRDGLRLAKSSRGDGAGRHELVDQIVADHFRALLRKALIEVVAADAIGMALDLDFESRICEENS